jgi:hypothetical protein
MIFHYSQQGIHMHAISSKQMLKSAIFVSVALMVLSGCSDAGPAVASNTCPGGELEGRTRTAAQGPCLDYVPSAK